MKDILMTKGAKILVDVCTKIKPKENVLVVKEINKFR